MPITPVTFPNHYVLTVETQNIANPLISWRNSLDIIDAQGNFPVPTDLIVVGFKNMLAGLMRNDCQLVKATLRNWTRGVQPFDQQASLWEDIFQMQGYSCSPGGAFNPATNLYENPTVGEVCVRLAKNNMGAGGRIPSMFMRNVVRDVDVSSVAGGRPTFIVPATPVTPAAINTHIASKIGAFLNTAALPHFVNIHYSIKHPVPPFATDIASIQTVGLTMHDLTHSSPK